MCLDLIVRKRYIIISFYLFIHFFLTKRLKIKSQMTYSKRFLLKEEIRKTTTKKAKPKNKAWVRILNQLRFIYRNRIKIYNFLPSSILHVFLKQASSSYDPVQILLFPSSSDQFETTIVSIFYESSYINFPIFLCWHFKFSITALSLWNTF